VPETDGEHETAVGPHLARAAFVVFDEIPLVTLLI
jgi:hypothetical protein